MFVQMSIHTAKPEYEALLIDSMHRFGAALTGKPGLREIHTFKDEKSGKLVGIAIWNSKEDMIAQRSVMIETTKDDDFDLWEAEEMEGFWLNKI